MRFVLNTGRQGQYNLEDRYKGDGAITISIVETETSEDDMKTNSTETEGARISNGDTEKVLRGRTIVALLLLLHSMRLASWGPHIHSKRQLCFPPGKGAVFGTHNDQRSQPLMHVSGDGGTPTSPRRCPRARATGGPHDGGPPTASTQRRDEPAAGAHRLAGASSAQPQCPTCTCVGWFTSCRQRTSPARAEAHAFVAGIAPGGRSHMLNHAMRLA